MSKPRKKKTIKGVEYGYCGNHRTNEKYRMTALYETQHQAAEREAAWLANAVLLAPRGDGQL